MDFLIHEAAPLHEIQKSCNLFETCCQHICTAVVASVSGSPLCQKGEFVVGLSVGFSIRLGTYLQRVRVPTLVGNQDPWPKKVMTDAEESFSSGIKAWQPLWSCFTFTSPTGPMRWCPSQNEPFSNAASCYLCSYSLL